MRSRNQLPTRYKAQIVEVAHLVVERHCNRRSTATSVHGRDEAVLRLRLYRR